MHGKRIKIKSQMPLWQFILVCLVLFAIGGGIFYLLFTQSGLQYRTRSNGWELIGLIIFIIPVMFSSVMSLKEYLADIYITDKEIKLVYKIRNKVTRTKIVKKDNIQSFELNADINVTSSGKYTRTDVSYKFFVDLIEGQDVYVSDISDITLTEGNYKFIYRVLNAAQYIPNFKFNLNSNNDIIKAELDYYRRFGRTIPFWTKFKMQMNKAPLWTKIPLFLCAISMLFCFSLLLVTSVPVYLNTTEKQYIEHISNSYDYKKDYTRALYELDKAKDLISTDPYLYYRYSYLYKKKKEYSTAVYYAKLGISNLGNKEVWYKQYKFLKPNTDVYLYEHLGDCYIKLEEWQNAVESYTYVVNSKKKAKYSKVYFWRGYSYFYLQKYEEAKQDFIKHKEIVSKYIETYGNEPNNSYTNKDLINVNEWIQACNDWLRYNFN